MFPSSYPYVSTDVSNVFFFNSQNNWSSNITFP